MESYLNIQIRVIKAQAEAQIRQLQLDLTSLNAQLRTTGTATGFDSGTRSLSSFTSGLRAAGYAMTTAFTLPIIGAGKNILDFTLANQTAAADLKKVYGTNPFGSYNNALTLLKKNFEALSDEYGVNQTEVINIGAAWAQAGVQGTALAESVENTLKTMVIGDMSATDSTNALIAIQAQYGANTQQLTAIINDLNVVENQTGISMSGLVQGFSRAAGAAADAGIDYRHLAALLAALTPAAGSASNAGNALKTIISRLLVPTTAASAVMKQMGINTNSAAWESASATTRLQDMALAFEKLNGQQQATVSATLASRFQISRFDILMRDMNNYLTGSKGLSYYGQALNNTLSPTKNAEIASRELQTVLKSNPQLLKEVGAQLKNSLSDTITPLIPVILSLADGLSSLAQWFGNLNPYVQKFIGVALLVLAALGPILLYVSAMASAVKYLGLAFNVLLSPVRMVGSLLGLLIKPFSLLLGAFGSTDAELETVSETIERTSANVVRAINSMATAVTAETDTMMADVDAAFTAGSAEAEAVWTTFGETITADTVATSTELVQVWDALWTDTEVATTVGMLAIEGAVDAGFIDLTRTFVAGAAGIEEVWGLAMESLVAETALLGPEMEVGAEVAGSGMLAAFAGLPSKIFGFFEGIGGKFAGFLEDIPGAILGVFEDIGPMLASAGSGLLDIITGPFAIAFAAVVALVLIFRKQITEAWQGVVNWFQSGASGLGSSFQGIEKIFDSGVAFVINAFNSLPAGIRGALQAVVNLVSEAAHDVYELFSYLNPFAHHSPSLVENVTAGMAEVARQFGTVTNISGPIKSAYNDIQAFGAATASVAQAAKASDMSTAIKSLTQAGGGAASVTLYKQLENDLDGLNTKSAALTSTIATQQAVVDADNAALATANANLNTQQATLDALTKTQTYWNNLIDQAKTNISNFSNAGIIGQQAMGDKIFANTEAQKKLQLEMMKMQDATGPIADVQSKLSDLAGEMETLRGQEATARANGAGSDILNSYDSQISALQAQSDAAQTSSDKYNALADALAALQNTGQELDLENSLKFDPLTHSIQEAANAMKELPFDTIMKGIADNKANLDKYTTAYDAATDAVNNQQKAVDSATKARDAAQKVYDAENAKLTTLQNSYQKVQQAISDINTALQTMTDNASKASAALGKTKAGGAGGGGGAGGLGSVAGGFKTKNLGNSLNSSATTKGLQALTDEALANVKKSMDKLDFITPLKAKWAQLVTWWGANITPGLKQFGSVVSGGLGKIDLGPLFKTITDNTFIKSMMSIISVVGLFVKGFMKLMDPEFTSFFHTIAGAAQEFGKQIGPVILPLLKSMMNLFEGLWETIQPFAIILGVVLLAAMKILAATFNGELKPALTELIGVLKGIIEIVTGVMNLIGDVLRGRWSKIGADLKLIVKGMWDAISALFKGFFGIILGAIEGFVKGIIHFFEWLADELVGHSIIPDMVNDIVTWFGNLPGMALKLLISGITVMLNWFRTLGGLILTAIGDATVWLVNKGIDAITGLLNGIVTGFKTVTSWFNGLEVVVQTYLKDALKWLVDHGNDLITGMWNGMVTAYKTIYNWFNQLEKELQTYLKDALKWLVSHGEDIISGMWTGIKNTFKSVTSWFGNLPGVIEGYLKNASGWLVSHGEDILSGMYSGIKNGYSSVKNWFSNLPGTLVGYFKNAGSWLVHAGESIAGGIYSGIKNGLSDAGNAAGNFISSIGGDIKSGLNNLLGLPYHIPTISLKIAGHGFTIGGETLIPRFAKGGIVDKPTNALIGEAGREVVIPLSDSHRAMDLLHQSGLWDLMMNQQKDAYGISAVGAANARMNSRTSQPTTQPSITYHDNTSHTYNFTGDLSFPNVTNAQDAEGFLSKLENMAGGVSR